MSPAIAELPARLKRGSTIRTFEEANQMLAWLANRFRCSVPALEFINNGMCIDISLSIKAGEYRDGKIKIFSSGQHPKHLTNTLLHEFTHHLGFLFCKDIDTPLSYFKTDADIGLFELHQDGVHGGDFTEHLIKVITAWRGNPRRYTWRTEYTSVQRWAKKLLS